MNVGIIGLGYVGLPLAVAFAEAGSDVIGLDSSSRVVEALGEGQSHVEDVSDEELAAVVRPVRSDHRRLPARRVRRGPDLRADAARQPPRARPLLHRRRRALAVAGPAPGTARRARVDHLPGHDARAPAADPRGVGPRRRARLPPRLLTRADRPRAHRPHDPHHPEGRRRAHRRLPRPRRRALLDGLRRGRARLDPRGSGADEAAGEHLPLRQHRARQRAGDPLRSDGDRHLGGGRRRVDEAVRVHALRARAGDGRPLPAGRSLLPRLQGARVRLPDRVHRAGGKGQPAAAALLRRQGRARAQRRRQAGPRLARAAAWGSPTRPASATCARPRR